MKSIVYRVSWLLAVIFFNVTVVTAQGTSVDVDKNLLIPVKSVAVLPLKYIGEGNDAKTKEMPYRLQEYTVMSMSNPGNGLQLQDPLQTNAILFKNGITTDNIREYTPMQLAEILKVRYLVIGNVMQELEEVRTVSNGHSQKREDRDRDRNKENRNRRTEHSHRTITTMQKYQTDVSINIYNANGERIYTNSRQSILSAVDAYKNALRYLLKRSPLYIKL